MSTSLERPGDYQFHLANEAVRMLPEVDGLHSSAKKRLFEIPFHKVKVSREYIPDQNGINVCSEMVDEFAADTWNSVQNVLQRYFLQRFQALNVLPGDQLSFTLNPYNITHGLGLQSVAVAVLRPRPSILGIGRKPNDLFLPDEWKHPTVGFLSPAILGEGALSYEADFSMPERCGELLYVVSPSGLFLGDSRRGIFHEHQHKIVPVWNPDLVRVVVASQNQYEKISQETNCGIYVCCYFKKD